MLRCILIASGFTASALHSPNLQEVDASEQVPVEDTALAEDEEIENEQDKDLDVDESADSFVAGDVEVDDALYDVDDDDLDLDDVDDDALDDDDDDVLDLDSDDDDDLDSLVEKSGDAGEDNGDDANDDDADDDDDEEEHEDGDDDDVKDEENNEAEEMSPTILAEAEENEESRELEFAADVPLQGGHPVKVTVFAKALIEEKPAMVIVTKSSCPHCKDLTDSMNANPEVKTLMKKFVAFHAPDQPGNQWHPEIAYVPRVFFYNEEGVQIDVHGPFAKYPYFFETSQHLRAGMQKALSQA